MPLTDFGVASTTLKLFPGYSSVITPAPFNAQNAGPISAAGLNTVGPISTGSATVVATGTAAATASGGSAPSGSGSSGGAGSTTGTAAAASKTGGGSSLDAPCILLSCGAIAAVLYNLAFF